MLSKEDILQFKIFEDMNIEELDAVWSISQEVRYNAGDVILEESSYGSGSDFFIILEGNVKVELESGQSHMEGNVSKRLAVLKSGDVFGEMGLLGKGRRSAKVSAYSDLIVRRVVHRELFQLFDNNPRLGYLIMRNLAAILTDRITDMNFMWRNQI